MTAVVIDGARRDLAGLPLLGAGGEAEVYDLGDGRALKLYKGPDHPDVVGEPARVAAARARLADLEAKLGEFPRGLPSAVVAPTGLARSTARGRAALGYVMPKVTGTPMFALGEPRHRRATATDLPTLVAAFADLHATLRALHAAGVVVGDLNDGNLLVDGGRCHLLDADSLQFGRWPCALYTERFVDPRLCDRAAAAPTPRAPHDPASDWFAYAVLLFRAWPGSVRSAASTSRPIPRRAWPRPRARCAARACSAPT
jgi:DNA-binding helix-hairpin-helix protein with protein kinase domain